MSPRLRKMLKMEVEPPPISFPAPVFIMGCMRSGTTFLLDKLTQHPQLLKVGAELRHVWTTLGKASCEGVCENKEAHEATTQAATDMTHYFSSFIRESRSLRRHAMRAKARFGRGQGTIFYDWENIRPVNKSTQLVNKIGYVHSLFPQAKIIFIIRSIHGHCSSMKSFIDHHYKQEQIIHHFPPQEGYSWTRIREKAKTTDMQAEDIYPGNFSVIPKMWLRLNKLAFEHISKLPPEDVAVVSYEDTVIHQAEILSKVFEFLELAPKHVGKAKKIAASTLIYKNTTTSGDPLSKWKKHLKHEEIDEVDRIINEYQSDYKFINQSLDKLKLVP